jgi:hypothetical protein
MPGPHVRSGHPGHECVTRQVRAGEDPIATIALGGAGQGHLRTKEDLVEVDDETAWRARPQPTLEGKLGGPARNRTDY